MKATLEFNLPEEREEYGLCNQASSLHCALWDFAQFLRGKIKYETLTEEQYAVYEEVRTKFYETLADHNLEL